MRSGKSIGLLLFGVVLVWGIIGWKIFYALKTPSSVSINTADLMPSEKENNFVSDTITANYRDPFLGSEATKVRPIMRVVKEKNAKSKVEMKSTVAWPDIILQGIGSAGNEKKKFCILNIQKRQYFMKEGEKIQNVEVNKILASSVELIFGGEKKKYTK